MRYLSLFIFFAIYSLFFAQGQIINVPNDQPTIQSAINASADGDTVLVADGTYFENINFKGKAITVASQFLIDGDKTHIDSTIINGSQPTHPDSGAVVTFISGEDTTSVLCGFTITGGSGNIDPYGLSSHGGGGIAIRSGAKILDNIITNNSITHLYAAGGGIVISGNLKTLLILNNEISNNKLIETGGNSKGGGGIFCYEAQGDLIYIANNIISDNVVSRSNGNLAGYGGGINLENSIAVVRNNLIKNNKAQFGGGIGLLDVPNNVNFLIINNTIVNNYASLKEGGIYNEGIPQGIINSIIWKNIDPNNRQVTNNLIVEYSCVEGGFVGYRNINLDPQFADTTNYYLSPTSPCVDAGNPLTMYFDVEDPNNPGYPLSPALGGLRNDMGAYGGNPNMLISDLPENITSIKVDNDTNYIPDRLNELVTTTGVVTSINFQKGSRNLGFYIQDETSGIYIFADNDDSTNFDIGDWVEVTGKVAQYSGLTEIEVTNTEVNLILLEKNHSFIQQTVYIDEILKEPERYEGKCIGIKALKKNSGTWPTTNSSTNLEITDGYKILTLRLDDDTDLGSNPEPVYPMDLVGIVSQFTSSQSANDSYQLMVNSYSDIEQNVQAAPSPYFFFSKESKSNEGTTYGITCCPSFVVHMDWETAKDLNEEDNFIYEIVILRDEDGVEVVKELSDNDGILTRTSTTNGKLMDLIQNYGEYDTTDSVWTFTGNWTIRVTDGNTEKVSSVDTIKNFTIQDKISPPPPPSDIEVELLNLPKEFTLEQNYPNPFNPSTTIKYSIPQYVMLNSFQHLNNSEIPKQVRDNNSHVTLKVYDILGREVATLVNQKQQPGFYEVTWNANNIPSGIYFYKLSAGASTGSATGFTEIRKMILLR